jgi:hypothetical protein
MQFQNVTSVTILVRPRLPPGFSGRRTGSFGFSGVSACHECIPAHNIHQEHCFGCHYPNLATALPAPVTLAESALEARRKPQN